MQPKLSPEEFYKASPKKPMATGVLFFNKKGELLIVKPSYKNHWSIPGGMVDRNESPREAGIREVREEIGIEILGLKFLCVDYLVTNQRESLQFIFGAGILSPGQIGNIKIESDEINEYKFLPVKEALPLLNKTNAKRIEECLKQAGIYLEQKV